MKKILLLLFCFSIFACSKDEDEATKLANQKQEIINALVGKWKFSRLSRDKEFTDIVNLRLSDNDKKDNYIEFTLNGVFICQYCDPNEYDSTAITFERGDYSVGFFENEPYVTTIGNVAIFIGAGDIGLYEEMYGSPSPNNTTTALCGAFTDIQYSQNTLTFRTGRFSSEKDLYAEYKRIE